MTATTDTSMMRRGHGDVGARTKALLAAGRTAPKTMTASPYQVVGLARMPQKTATHTGIAQDPRTPTITTR